MRFPLVAVVAFFQINGCASRETIEVPPPPESVSQQQEFLEIALTQESPVDTLLEAGWRTVSRLELIQAEKAYRFVQLENPETNGIFGLLLKDGKLDSVLSRERSAQLHACLTPFNLDEKHWSDVSFDVLFGRAQEYSILGDKEALKATGTFTRYKDDSSTAETRRTIDSVIAGTVTVAAYSPFIVAGAPFYLANVFTDEPEGDSPDYEELRAFTSALKLGGRVPEGGAGLSTSIDFEADLIITQLDHYDFSYSAQDERIVLIESPSLKNLYDRQKDFGAAWYQREDCNEFLSPDEL